MSFSSKGEQVFHSQDTCFLLCHFIFSWPVPFVMTLRALLALESTECLVGPTLGSSNIPGCIDCRSRYSEKESCRKSWNLHVKWTKSLGISWVHLLVRCFVGRFRITLTNFKGLKLLKSFCESLDECNFITT